MANDVQAHESEGRSRRCKPTSFSAGLDDILMYLNKHPKQYKARPDHKKSKVDFLFMYNIQNAGMTTVSTKNANYNFLILNRPKVVEDNKRYFKIRFLNQQNEICTSKFTNCYEHLIDDIKKDNFK